MKKIVIIAITIVVVVVIGIVAISNAFDRDADKELTVGVIFNGSITDKSWTQDLNLSMTRTILIGIVGMRIIRTRTKSLFRGVCVFANRSSLFSKIILHLKFCRQNQVEQELELTPSRLTYLTD